MNGHAKFFDSKDGDRKYNAQDFRDWLRDLYPTGVMENGFFVTANDDMTVTIGAGFVNISGSVKTFDEATFEIPTAGDTDRIDAIVIELNENEKDIIVRYETGTPEAPTPVRTDEIYQLIPAEITVKAGVTSITQSNITDTRMITDLCGYIVRLVDSYDFTTILAEYRDYTEQFITDNFDEFDKWFQQMRSIFTAENVAEIESMYAAIQMKLSQASDFVDASTQESISLHNRMNAILENSGSVNFKSVTPLSQYNALGPGSTLAYVTEDEWNKINTIILPLTYSTGYGRGSTMSLYSEAILTRQAHPSGGGKWIMEGMANFATYWPDSSFTYGQCGVIASFSITAQYDEGVIKLKDAGGSFRPISGSVIHHKPSANQFEIVKVETTDSSTTKTKYTGGSSNITSANFSGANLYANDPMLIIMDS